MPFNIINNYMNTTVIMYSTFDARKPLEAERKAHNFWILRDFDASKPLTESNEKKKKKR